MTQLDLFTAPPPLTTEQRRHRDALTCLRDAVPDALDLITHLRYLGGDDPRAPRTSGAWAYRAGRAGLRVEAAADWWTGARERGETWGYARTPAHLTTWDDLHALIGDDPRRAAIAAWAAALPEPRWRQTMRPHELWPNPGGWHIGYLCRDHLHPQWTARRHAWQLVLDLLDDAIDRIDRIHQGGTP